MATKSLWFVIPLACATACVAAQGDDGSGGDGQLGASPDALTDTSTGPAVTAGETTEVWSATNAWLDRDTPAAAQKGVAWEASSGLNWEEKFSRWIASVEKTRNADDSNDTILIPTPFGKKLPGPALECGETAVTLRVMFSSWYHLPFYIAGWDAKNHRMIYAGHFGFVDASGAGVSGYARFKTEYSDRESSWNLGNPWPHDTALRKLHLGKDDGNAFLNDGTAGAGAYFDEMFLNKRVGYFLRMALVNFGSVNLADGANMFHIQPEATSAGDVLLERYQREGIGHTVPVFRAVTLPSGKLAATVASGSMPRRQAFWNEPQDARHYFVNEEMGGEGQASDGTPYAKLGGGIRRWRIAAKTGGTWSNIVAPQDQKVFISNKDLAAIAARPKKFDQIFAFGTPQERKDAAIVMIEAARTRLRGLPASCSARALREDGFQMLYTSLGELEQLEQQQIDAKYRKLEDYVFADLDYTKSKTCCWNTTTPAMAEIVLSQAKVEQDKATAAKMCKQPTAFRATKGGGDGYTLWSSHAKEMGRAADWRAWSEDEPCAQKALPEDSISFRGQQDYCGTIAVAPDADAGVDGAADGGADSAADGGSADSGSADAGPG